MSDNGCLRDAEDGSADVETAKSNEIECVDDDDECSQNDLISSYEYTFDVSKSLKEELGNSSSTLQEDIDAQRNYSDYEEYEEYDEVIDIADGHVDKPAQNYDAAESFEPDSICDLSVAEHSGCQPVFMSQVLKGLPPVDQMSNVHIHSPLEYMLYAHISAHLPVAEAREIVETIRFSNSVCTLKSYVKCTRKYITSLVVTEDLLREALSMRMTTCRVAFKSLRDSGRKGLLIKYRPLLDDDEVSAEQQKQWKKLFDRCPLILEQLRAKMVFNTAGFLYARTVIIGDSEGDRFNSVARTVFITGNSDQELLDLVRGTVFSAQIKVILICIGADKLRGNVDASQIVRAITDIVNALLETRIRIVIVPPAFNSKRRGNHQALLQQLYSTFFQRKAELGMSDVEPALTRNFRSLPELTRSGKNNNHHHVNADGYLTDGGVIQTLLHLKCVYRVPLYLNHKMSDPITIRKVLQKPLIFHSPHSLRPTGDKATAGFDAGRKAAATALGNRTVARAKSSAASNDGTTSFAQLQQRKPLSRQKLRAMAIAAAGSSTTKPTLGQKKRDGSFLRGGRCRPQKLSSSRKQPAHFYDYEYDRADGGGMGGSRNLSYGVTEAAAMLCRQNGSGGAYISPWSTGEFNAASSYDQLVDIASPLSSAAMSAAYGMTSQQQHQTFSNFQQTHQSRGGWRGGDPPLPDSTFASYYSDPRYEFDAPSYNASRRWKRSRYS